MRSRCDEDPFILAAQASRGADSDDGDDGDDDGDGFGDAAPCTWLWRRGALYTLALVHETELAPALAFVVIGAPGALDTRDARDARNSNESVGCASCAGWDPAAEASSATRRSVETSGGGQLQTRVFEHSGRRTWLSTGHTNSEMGENLYSEPP